MKYKDKKETDSFTTPETVHDLPSPLMGFAPGPEAVAQARRTGFWRDLVEELPGILWSTDSGLRFRANSGVGLRALGLAPGQLAGVSLFDYFRTADPSFPAIAAHLSCLRGETVPYRVQWQGRTYRALVEPLRDERGAVVGCLGTALDVTWHREAEGALAAQGPRPAAAPGQRLEAVELLAAGVAHDLNNLLTPILGHSDSLLSYPEVGNVRESLEAIRACAERAAGLAQQLLALGTPRPNPPPGLDLNGRVDGLENLLRRLLGPSVLLEVTLGPGRLPVRLDPGQADQILLNLALNAREAMPEGGRLRVQTRAGEGASVVLVVSDTGCGMDERVRARVFETRFTTKGPGRGLGLALVQDILTRAGGHITVESAPGRGTTFTVYLPRVEGES